MAASIRPNFSWMAAGRAMYFGSQLLLLTIVARMTTPETFGEFAYALSVTGPIIVLCQLNARAFLVTQEGRSSPIFAVNSFRG